MRRAPTEGPGRHIHLVRAARLAGEAFAFPDPELDEARAWRMPLGGVASLFLAAAAAAALYLAL